MTSRQGFSKVGLIIYLINYKSKIWFFVTGENTSRFVVLLEMVVEMSWSKVIVVAVGATGACCHSIVRSNRSYVQVASSLPKLMSAKIFMCRFCLCVVGCVTTDRRKGSDLGRMKEVFEGVFKFRWDFNKTIFPGPGDPVSAVLFKQK